MWRVIYLSAILFSFNIKNLKANCIISSQTTVSGTYANIKEICSGDLIFNDDFDTFDLKKWQHEITLSGGGNWEFQYYTNNRSNSYVDQGCLHLKPTFLTDDYDDAFLSSGTLDVNGGSPTDQCTDPSYYGCSRTGTSTNYLNPIKSARIRTSESFSFKYGKAVIKAKMPSGDWLWPAVWLHPRYNAYGKWPASGEIDILESRGNKQLTDSNGTNVGTQQVTSTLHWGPFYQADRWQKTHFTIHNSLGFDNDFHIYEILWTPENISLSIDNTLVGTVTPPEKGFWELGEFENSDLDNPWKGSSKIAPFDQEFYIIINLAVGGISFFDDDNVNPGGKPWENKSPIAFKDFWTGRSQWMPTWNLKTDDTHLVIDYVKVYAL